MWRDELAEAATLVCEVGSTRLGYQLRCIYGGLKPRHPTVRRVEVGLLHELDDYEALTVPRSTERNGADSPTR